MKERAAKEGKKTRGEKTDLEEKGAEVWKTRRT